MVVALFFSSSATTLSIHLVDEQIINRKVLTSSCYAWTGSAVFPFRTQILSSKRLPAIDFEDVDVIRGRGKEEVLSFFDLGTKTCLGYVKTRKVLCAPSPSVWVRVNDSLWAFYELQNTSSTPELFIKRKYSPTRVFGNDVVRRAH